MATVVVAGVILSPGLRVGGNSGTKLRSSSFLSRSFPLGCSRTRDVPSVSVATQERSSRLLVRNAVTTEARDDFTKVSDDDYAENFRPPHITDVFDVPARPSTFCAKTR